MGPKKIKNTQAPVSAKKSKTVDDSYNDEELEKQAPVISTGAAFDATWIFLLYAALVCRNAMYPKEMYDIYEGKIKIFPTFFDNFYTFMRVYLTRLGNGHLPFPLWRNIVFNIIREGMCYTYPRMLFEMDKCDQTTIINFFQYNAVKCVIYTVVLQYLPYGFHYRTKPLVQYLRTEYFMAMPFFNIHYMSLLNHQDHYRGDMLWILFACMMQLHDRTGWEYFEDIIFGDMGTFHVGQFIGWIGYWAPMFVMFGALGYYEKWEMYYDFWPGYDHCKNPANLIFNSQCRPRIYGFKETVSHLNPRYNYHYVYFTAIFEFFCFIGCYKAMRMMRAQEASHKAIKPWLKKAKAKKE